MRMCNHRGVDLDPVSFWYDPYVDHLKHKDLASVCLGLEYMRMYNHRGADPDPLRFDPDPVRWILSSGSWVYRSFISVPRIGIYMRIYNRRGSNPDPFDQDPDLLP